jgi:KDO2-lipid IV(A) lauroyltransferase
MAKPRNKHVDYLQYVGMRLFVMFVHMFSLRANYRVAAIIGDLLFKFDRRHRTRAVEHIRRSFPAWSEDRIRRVARASLRSLVYLGVEFVYTPRLLRVETWRKCIRLVNMGRTIELLLRRDSGIIFLTGHFGNWEIAGYMMAVLGFPTVSVARRLDNPYIDRYVIGIREKTGQAILDKKGASSVVPDVLASKGAVGFIADQDAGKRGMFVDFFGRKASTFKTIALVAMEYRVPVVVGYGKRLEKDAAFEVGIERVIMPDEWQNQDDPSFWITQEFTWALERVIRRDPEQYLWAHRRWKHRPKGEEPAPGGIA